MDIDLKSTNFLRFVFLIGLLFVNSIAIAHPNILTIEHGYDLFSTPLAPDVEIPLPAGATQTTATVNFVGNPLKSGLSTTDTIVERIIDNPFHLGADETTDTFNIELVGLSLKSNEPVNYVKNGETVHADAYAAVMKPGGDIEAVFRNAYGDNFANAIADKGLSPSLGVMEIAHRGGDPHLTYDSCWDTNCFADPLSSNKIAAAIVYTDVGDASVVLDVEVWEDSLSATVQAWSTTPPPGYPEDDRFPAGNFYPAGETIHTGPHTPVRPVPEPSTYALLALGIGALAFRFRRRVAFKA